MTDRCVVIIECKGHRIPDPARRGGHDSMTSVIEKLIVEPTIQANRFIRFLREHPGVHRFQTKKGPINEIDTSPVQEYLAVNLTADLIPAPSISWRDLCSAGFLPSDLEPTPTMSIWEWEIVIELLEGACEKLHYLSRRRDFEKHIRYFGDEMDLLVCYLENAFSVGSTFWSGIGSLILHGLSDSNSRPTEKAAQD